MIKISKKIWVELTNKRIDEAMTWEFITKNKTPDETIGHIIARIEKAEIAGMQEIMMAYIANYGIELVEDGK